MKKSSVFLLALALSFSILFTGIGYAKLTKTLSVTANLQATMPNAVFISKVTLKSENDATATVNSHTQRVINTTVILGSSADASVSFQIEFYNNTDKDMAYVGTLYDEAAYDNSDIAYTVSDVLHGQTILLKGKLTLTLTFSYRDGVSADKVLNSLIGFQFGEVIDFEQEEEDGTFEPSESYNTLVKNALTNANRYGLNDSHKGYVLHNALASKKILYSSDHTTGGNIDKFYESLQVDESQDIDFVFEYVSETEYVAYLFNRKNVTEGSEITVYKQYFHYDTTHYNKPQWIAGTALIGHATIKEVKSSVLSIVPSEWQVGALKTISP